jgi:hypothetical protein
MLQAFLSFSLQYWVLDIDLSISISIISLLIRVILVLLRVDTKALGNELNIYAINVLDKPCNGW